jgi:hypothetical protein
MHSLRCKEAKKCRILPHLLYFDIFRGGGHKPSFVPHSLLSGLCVRRSRWMGCPKAKSDVAAGSCAGHGDGQSQHHVSLGFTLQISSKI